MHLVVLYCRKYCQLNYRTGSFIFREGKITRNHERNAIITNINSLHSE